jgi:ABC-type antimicrobial peptide transport system permease subunit
MFFNDILMTYVYATERKMGSIAGYFTFLSILISCLGLFGLASFMAEQRTKEIGIRRVLGAPVTGVIYLLSKDFTKWIAVSNAIALPIAYLIIRNLMSRYVYHTTIGIEVFFLSGLGILLLALVTVSWQTYRAADANPVDSLRYE